MLKYFPRRKLAEKFEKMNTYLYKKERMSMSKKEGPAAALVDNQNMKNADHGSLKRLKIGKKSKEEKDICH